MVLIQFHQSFSRNTDIFIWASFSCWEAFILIGMKNFNKLTSKVEANSSLFKVSLMLSCHIILDWHFMTWIWKLATIGEQRSFILIISDLFNRFWRVDVSNIDHGRNFSYQILNLNKLMTFWDPILKAPVHRETPDSDHIKELATLDSIIKHKSYQLF